MFLNRAVMAAFTAMLLSACQSGGGDQVMLDGGRDGSASAYETAPAKVILDTDIKDDVDDVGAMAVLHALADLGEAEILAVMVNTLSPCGATAVDVINTYYGRPDIPIGLRLPLDDECSAIAFDPNAYLNERYPLYLTENYPNDLNVDEAPSAAQLYCDVLAAEEDDSVVIASVGFLRNLADLLSYDCPGHAETGMELVEAKVQRLEVMGGAYPGGPSFNFGADFPEYFEGLYELDPFHIYTSAEKAINDWPGQIVFNGFEVGNTVQTGSTLFTDTPEGNPVREAYRLYVGEGGTRPSWDHITVWHAIRGDTEFFEETGEDGRNNALPFGANFWGPDPENEKEHTYMLKIAEDAEIAAELDLLMSQGPLFPNAGQ